MSLTKKKRVSKRHKSTWRKTDIKDVEEFLEEQRQEERIGTFDKKIDAELFIDDQTSLKTKRGLTGRQKRKLNAQKPLRSHEPLKNTSKVPDPIVKRNKVKQKKSGRNIEEEVSNPTKPRHFQANRDRQQYYETLDKKKENKFEKDLWEETDVLDEVPGLRDEKGWVSRELAMHVAKHILRKPFVKVHDSVRHRTTKAKNFSEPHPGISYNPSLADHQKLLNEIVQREENIIKEAQHLKRVTTKMFSKVTEEEREQRKLQEMRAGMDDDDDDDEEQSTEISNSFGSTEDTSTSYATVNPPVQNKKKTKQKRNKELRQKELLKKHAEKKALKKQIVDLNRLKNLKAEVISEEENMHNLMKRRQKTALRKKFETKRLGRLKFVEPDTDMNMPEDIKGNLRNVKLESSLLVDRFKDFQKRNILPVSVHTGKQKPRKVKRFPRSSHKDPGISYDMLRQQRKEIGSFSIIPC